MLNFKTVSLRWLQTVGCLLSPHVRVPLWPLALWPLPVLAQQPKCVWRGDVAGKHSFFFFGCTCSTWKFPGQGLNPCHSSDSTRTLTHWATRELPTWTLGPSPHLPEMSIQSFKIISPLDSNGWYHYFPKSVSLFLPIITGHHFQLFYVLCSRSLPHPSFSHLSLVPPSFHPPAQPSQSLPPRSTHTALHHQLPPMPRLCRGWAQLWNGAWLTDFNQGCVLKESYPDFDKKLLK